MILVSSTSKSLYLEQRLVIKLKLLALSDSRAYCNRRLTTDPLHFQEICLPDDHTKFLWMLKLILYPHWQFLANLCLKETSHLTPGNHISKVVSPNIVKFTMSKMECIKRCKATLLKKPIQRNIGPYASCSTSCSNISGKCLVSSIFSCARSSFDLCARAQLRGNIERVMLC